MNLMLSNSIEEADAIPCPAASNASQRSAQSSARRTKECKSSSVLPNEYAPDALNSHVGVRSIKGRERGQFPLNGSPDGQE